MPSSTRSFKRLHFGVSNNSVTLTHGTNRQLNLTSESLLQNRSYSAMLSKACLVVCLLVGIKVTINIGLLSQVSIKSLIMAANLYCIPVMSVALSVPPDNKTSSAP